MKYGSINFSRVPEGLGFVFAAKCNICLDPLTPGELEINISCCDSRYHVECLSLWVDSSSGVSPRDLFPKCTGCDSQFSVAEFHATIARIACGQVIIDLASPIERVSIITLVIVPVLDRSLQGGPYEIPGLGFPGFDYDGSRGDQVVIFGESRAEGKEACKDESDGDGEPEDEGGCGYERGEGAADSESENVVEYGQIYGAGTGIYIYEDPDSPDLEATYPPNVNANHSATDDSVLREIEATPSEASTDIEIPAVNLTDPLLRGGLHVQEPTAGRRLGSGRARQNSSANGSNRENENPETLCIPISERVAMEVERLHHRRMAALEDMEA